MISFLRIFGRVLPGGLCLGAVIGVACETWGAFVAPGLSAGGYAMASLPASFAAGALYGLLIQRESR